MVENFSLKADRGDLVQIIGKNGSGKTSILKIISGLMPIFDGTIEWAGKAIQSQTSYSRNVNYLGHMPGLSPELTGFENLQFYKTLSQAKKPAMEIPEALSACGASNIRSKPTKFLSAGEKQKLVLARILMFDCPLWLLDEPFNSLDAKTQSILENQIDNHTLRGGTVLITSHQPFKTRRPLMSVSI